MSGQELKELIDNEIITLEELDNTALEKILNFETDMLCFGTGDMNTIRRCSELLNERNDSDILNKDKIISIIDKVQSEHIIIVSEETKHEPEAKVIKRKHITLRRIGLVAAILALMVATNTLVSAAFGINIFEYISKIVRQDEGTQMVVDDFTFYHNGEAKQYSSIEEMIEEENLNIMYPTKWPDGITIDRISVLPSESGGQILQMLTNDAQTNLVIKLNAPNSSTEVKDNELYNKGDLQYYIFYNDGCFAYCFKNGNSYSFQARNREEILIIIDSMKE